MIGRRAQLENVKVKWEWGDHALEVDLRNGTAQEIVTDGPFSYPLVEVHLDGNTLVIKPRCLMIHATPETLKRYAAILEA